MEQLSKIKVLEDLKNEGFQYLYKYHNLNSNDKLTTLLENKLWASFPQEFNDVFDSQVRLNDSDIEKLAYEFVSPTNQLEDIKWLLKTSLEQVNSANISCFSLCDPLDATSAHMWGLYACNGNGVVTQYDIDSLITYNNQTMLRDGSDFHDVAYDKNYDQKLRLNKLAAFKKYINLLIDKERCNEKITRALISIYTTKSKQWEHEQEFRFISVRVMDNRNNPNVDLQKHIMEYRNNKNSCSFDFIEPIKVIFGWNAFTGCNKEYNMRIREAFSDSCIELQGDSIDYEKGRYLIK